MPRVQTNIMHEQKAQAGTVDRIKEAAKAFCA